MRITHNLSASAAFNALNKTNAALDKVIRSLSTGLRINSASDDAAGFAMSEKMRAQTGGLDTALRNSQDGISLLQTAEGALEQTSGILQRMRSLSVQASNDTLTAQDRQYIQLEIDKLKDDIDRIAGTTQFNRKRLLDGSCGALWAASDNELKAKIRGGLTYTDDFGQTVSDEGNYRIEVEAEAGKNQVQKSNIMLIKHKDVAMDKTVNRQAGINNVRVSNVPPGNYEMHSVAPSEAHAIATGVYGLGFDELDAAITVQARNSYLLNNASVLFEVVSAEPDKGTITVNAAARILKTDGTTDMKTCNNIVLSAGSFTDLSEALGVGKAGTSADNPDGGFELQLVDAGAFEAGDKFVYNLTVAKDVEGADRAVKLDQTVSDDSWKPELEVYKTNQFKPEEPLDTSAKVVFLIDNSSSMTSHFATVRTYIKSFLANIKSQGVTDIQVGIARYFQGLRNSSYDWYTEASQIEAALAAPPPDGGGVDPYKAITETIAKYDMSDVTAKHIVLITDTWQENSDSDTTLKKAQDALSTAGITLSAVYNNQWPGVSKITDDIQPLITSNGMDLYIKDEDWGKTIAKELGQQIGQEAMDPILNGTPLYQYKQFASLFPNSSAPARTITITKDGETTDITVEASDSLKTLAAKIDAVTGGTTEIKLSDDEDDGEKGLVLITKLEDSTGLTFSGDNELINTIGFRSNRQLMFSLDADKVTDKDIHFKSFYVNSETGEVQDGDITLTTNSTEIPEYDKLTSFEAAYIGQIPKHDVSLRDINNFWNTQGVFMVEHPQTITITQGDGKTASVTLYESDTIEDVRSKLNDAIAHGLGQAQYTDRENFVSFVNEGSESPQTSESVAGTFVIRTAVAGHDGELSFSGDDDILHALGLNTIQESSETRYTVSVYDAHSGKVRASGIKSSGNVIHGAVHGVDIEFGHMAGLKSTWDESTKRFIASSGEKYTGFIHLSDSSTTFQTGANMGESFSIQLGDMSCEALGISGVNLATKERAARSITIIDSALHRVSSQRAKIGAYTNAMEYTMENLTTTSTNVTAAESRIRDADMSQMMMEFVKLQILNQSGMSMLAQANQLPRSVLNLMS